jgi:uncharacterized membrane protein YeaQ/YmgE (transglycosylase-associated protein family)
MGIIDVLSWIVFGLIAGITAKLVMPGRDPGGCIVTILLGIAGAFLGGFLYEYFTDNVQDTPFDLGSFFLAVVGAVIILAVYRAVVGRSV